MDGFVNLNKEAGMSSHTAMARVRKLLQVKAGHSGTLDPMATGVLPLCLGKATRLAEYITEQPKRYLARVSFGVETDSYDAAGAVLARQDASHLTREEVEALLPRFCGCILQTPPVISALKQGGEPLYKRARRGETVEVQPREVKIYSITAGEGSFGSAAPYLDLEVYCGKGTYIRSLAHDLGALLNVGAHLSALTRLAVGPFRLDGSYTLAELEQKLAAGDSGFVLPMQAALSHLPVAEANQAQLKKLVHGNAVPWPSVGQELAACQVITPNGRLLGIGKISPTETGEWMLQMTKVLAEPADLAATAPQTQQEQSYVVAIGNFDGLHLGHRQLMCRMAELKQKYRCKSAVLTFHPHPLALIQGTPPPLLNTAAEKSRLVACYGADQLIQLEFTPEMMHSSPADFVRDLLTRYLKACHLVVGFNFSFGAAGAGTAKTLRQLAHTYGVEVDVVEAVTGPYGVVSSSNIRKHLAAGDFEAANAMLGYWYEMSGQVIQGNQLGRTLGFPTANFLPPADKVLPPCGVYAVRICHQGETYDGVANFGKRPSIHDGEINPLVEANLFDTKLPLYGDEIEVFFGKFLRGEHKFAGLEELTAQITADSEAAREFLATVPADAHLPKCLNCDIVF